jgi:hypothetical protein
LIGSPAGAVFAQGSAAGAQGTAPAARMETFTAVDGREFFALAVMPGAEQKPAAAAAGSDLVVLFDTSASQVNQFRDKALDALQFLLGSLTENDRVRLFAVDVDAVPLTNDFVAPAGAEMQAAMEALRARTPLGTTDMQKALTAAVGSFDGAAADRLRSVAYLGDGMSLGNLVAGPDMQLTVDALCAKQVSVNSFAIGPRVDTQLLGVLANHTGGMLLTDSDNFNGKQFGAYLAECTAGLVAWPTKTTLPDSFVETYPAKFPPLRFNRDTVLIGLAKPVASVDVVMDATVLGKPVSLAWKIAPIATADDHSYLPELIELARKDAGISLPTVGSSGLKDMRRLVNVEAYSLLQLGKQAVAVGSYDQAEKLVDEALRLDPANGEAQAIRNAVLTARKEGKAGQPHDLKLVNFQPAAGEAVPGAPVAEPPAAPAAGAPAAAPGEAEAAPGSLLGEAGVQSNVIKQIITVEVQNGLNQARSIMGRDPDAARGALKALQDRVIGVPELEGAVKTQLLEQIETGLRTADRQAKLAEEIRLQQEAALASQQEQDRLYRDLIGNQQKTEQLMARFEDLMDERRYRDAENAARLAQDFTPNAPAVTAATRWALQANTFANAMAYRQEHWKNMAYNLLSIERSGIPFADDAPILYPSKDIWELITEKRKKFDRISLAQSNEAEARILDELERRTEVQYLDTQLGDVVNDLELRHKINIELDNAALTADGKGSETLINKQLKDLTLKSALRLILEEQGLTYVIENEVLVITTKTAAETKTPTRVYPVADLVIPIPQGGLSGFGGLGGGMGGGMGGGGMGGMGGMGGGGMGGMGGGGGMFAVEDDLRLSAKNPAPQAAPAPAAAAQAADDGLVMKKAAAADELSISEIKPIKLTIEEGADPAKAWDAHFAANSVEPAAVRATVRTLFKADKPDHVAAVIMAALKHGQPQPWMYEALGLALETQGARVSEIERVLLSAVDFSNQPDDLLKVAEYMVKSNLGNGALQRRALDLYRQVSKMQPTRPEPYVYGLRIANRLDDVEGLKWTSLGIVGQAWPNDQREIYEAGLNTAKGLVERLKSEKRAAEAEAFQTALNEAQIRDCVITVSWSGDADIDLIVEEPTGTLCSFRNPRSTAGGVLIGDTYDKATNLHTETYVCPQGFNGDYRLLAKRVWGKVTADTVTVDITAHKGSPKQRGFHKQIPLDGDQAVAAFDLQNGRRVESLKDFQVANAVQGQMALGNQILAQQIGTASDPGLGVTPVIDPRLFLRGAVGYQPVIITLPTGTNMSATAVVSHDRRYVRITAQPMFSRIPEVNTFNYVAGSGGTSGGTGS